MRFHFVDLKDSVLYFCLASIFAKMVSRCVQDSLKGFLIDAFCKPAVVAIGACLLSDIEITESDFVILRLCLFRKVALTITSRKNHFVTS